MSPVRVAVFPAAGLGTRFLPATKAQPKEMLPLVDRPLVQYVVDAAEPCIGQMMRVYERRGHPVIALQEVPHEQTRQYGIVGASPVPRDPRVVAITDMVEKPRPEDAPSNLAIIGRYLLPPEI